MAGKSEIPEWMDAAMSAAENAYDEEWEKNYMEYLMIGHPSRKKLPYKRIEVGQSFKHRKGTELSSARVNAYVKSKDLAPKKFRASIDADGDTITIRIA